VTALADPRNGRSLVALDRIGFIREGVLRDWQIHSGSVRDCAILRMTRSDYDFLELAAAPPSIEGELPEAFSALAEGGAGADAGARGDGA
jgi:hypothetical protein